MSVPLTEPLRGRRRRAQERPACSLYARMVARSKVALKSEQEHAAENAIQRKDERRVLEDGSYGQTKAYKIDCKTLTDNYVNIRQRLQCTLVSWLS